MQAEIAHFLPLRPLFFRGEPGVGKGVDKRGMIWYNNYVYDENQPPPNARRTYVR